MASSSVPSDPDHLDPDTGIADMNSEILKKDTPLGIAWRAASHLEIDDDEIEKIDINQTCRDILQIPNSNMPIKSIILTGGVARILLRRLDGISEDLKMLQDLEKRQRKRSYEEDTQAEKDLAENIKDTEY